MVNRHKTLNKPEKKRSGFNYKPRSAKQVRERGERSGGNFDTPFLPGVDTYRPENGDNLVRILPPTWDGADHYGMTIWVHAFVGADSSTYLCPRKMLNKKCPICEAAKLAKDNGEADEAKQLQVQEKLICYVLDRDEDDNIPRVWMMSWTQDRDINALCYNKRSGEVLLIDHPDEGYDLTIKRHGKGLGTRYNFIVDRDPTPIADKQSDADEVLEFIKEKPLDGVLKYFSAEHMEASISGSAEEPDEDADDDEDAKPQRRGRAAADDDDDDKPVRRGTARRAAEPEEDEDEDEDPPPRRGKGRQAADEDEDDDPPPRKSQRRVTRDEPEEDEDDEDDEDDRPPPKKGRRGSDDDDDEPPKKAKSRVRNTRGEEEEEVPDEDEDDDPPPRRTKPGKRR